MTHPTRHDGLLAAIPASLASGVTVGWLSSLPTLFGVGGGGLVAALFVIVSLFVAPPS